MKKTNITPLSFERFKQIYFRMKYSIKGILLIGILSISIESMAQSDNYDWSFKLGSTIFSNIVNTGTTYGWYGNAMGPEFFLEIGYNNYILNTSLRYFNNPTKKNLPYDNTYYYLPEGANINMVFWNIGLSYEKEIIKRLFFEPNVGFLRNFISSNIIGFDGKEFDIKDLSGLTLGVNIIQYIKFTDGYYLGLYVSGNYNFINYRKLNYYLNNNSFGYAIGCILKFTDIKKKKPVKWIPVEADMLFIPLK